MDNGRLMAIVRIGDRKPSPEILQTLAVDGTILLPGETHLKAPVAAAGGAVLGRADVRPDPRAHGAVGGVLRKRLGSR